MRKTVAIYKKKIRPRVYDGQEIPRSPEVGSWALLRVNHINSIFRAENQCSISTVRSGKDCLKVFLFQSCLQLRRKEHPCEECQQACLGPLTQMQTSL